MTLNAIQVNEVLRHIQPTLPIEVADCVAVRDLIKPYVPQHLTIDVMHDSKAIHVRLHNDHNECVYSNELMPE